jgi:hypothetical protein
MFFFKKFIRSIQKAITRPKNAEFYANRITATSASENPKKFSFENLMTKPCKKV